MTDDDRMDRARRIREMREGSRPDAQADDDPEPAGDPAPDSGSTEAGDSDPDPDPAGTGDPDSGGTDAAGADDPGTTADAPDAATESDGDGGLQVPAAEGEDVEIDVEAMAQQAGLDTSGTGGGDAGDGIAGPAGMTDAADTQVETAAETRVLEFDLGDERYCLDIDHVEEIVERETVTRVPNTPAFVEGVVDLRGQITTILDPKVLLGIDAEGDKELIVVFDPDEFEDQGAVGWVVDDVNQVTPVVESEVNDPPVDEDHINGVVERDGEFVIWADPRDAIESATE